MYVHTMQWGQIVIRELLSLMLLFFQKIFEVTCHIFLINIFKNKSWQRVRIHIKMISHLCVYLCFSHYHESSLQNMLDMVGGVSVSSEYILLRQSMLSIINIVLETFGKFNICHRKVGFPIKQKYIYTLNFKLQQFLWIFRIFFIDLFQELSLRREF